MLQIDEPLYASFQVTDPTDSVNVIGTELCMKMDSCAEDNASTTVGAYSLLASSLVILSFFNLV
jgi:hypothetical protein